MIWTPFDWVHKFYSFCMVAVVDIINRRGLRVDICHRNQSGKSELAVYMPLLLLYQLFKTVVGK